MRHRNSVYKCSYICIYYFLICNKYSYNVNVKLRNETKLRDTLRQLQRLAGVSFERKITHKDLSELAGVKKRAVDEWMRGAVQPPAMAATFELLSKLQEQDVLEVLKYWKKLNEKNTETV